MRSLDSRVALVTGAASGIGAALARTLTDRGATVALLDRDAAGLAAVAEPLGARAFSCDVTDSAAVAAVAEAVHRDLGPVDLLFVNAGVAAIGPVCTMPVEDARWVLEVNLMGSLITLQAFVPEMRRAGRGRVVVTGSIASLVGAPSMGVYSASKFGLLGLAESLRVELHGTGVGVTVVCPGRVDTGLHRATRYHHDGFRRYLDAPSRFQLTPEVVARRALEGALAGRAVVPIGVERAGVWLRRLSVTAYSAVVSRLFTATGLCDPPEALPLEDRP